MVGGVVLAGLTLATGGGTVRATAKPPTTDTLRQGLLQLPLAFEKNAGQLDARVRYLARGSGYALFLTSDEAVLRLRKPTTGEAPAGDATVRMRLAGAQRTARATTGSRLPGHSNYYLGNDPSKWRRSVERFARVCYQGIYRGVDLVYYGRQGQLEYDFVVQPGADPGRIRMEFAGAETARLTPEGDLLLTTAAGDLRQHRPVVYQEVNGRRREVSGRYQMARADSGEVAVGFETGAYDVTRPLIIDPVLSFSTYLGGGGTDLGTDIEVDADGYVYVTGRTASSNFPTANPNQGYVGAGGASTTEGADTFVTKLAPTGDALVYSTYLGGSGL
ncbi:MAG: hypothetical protein K0Q72_4900, partial [Armatimonadetes bacterium]|nr:hypothetical protein [Armatimonadota bacterium]